MPDIDRAKKLLEFVKDKDLAIYKQVNNIAESLEKLSTLNLSLASLEKLFANIEQIRGVKGEDGKTPTDEELLELIKPLIPEVKDGVDGKTPSKSELLALIRPLVERVGKSAIPTDTRLKKLIKPLIPKVQDGKDGKDGSPDSAEQVRDKLESLKDENRLDASAIKNLPKFIKEKSKELVVGGIRFLENLADVSINITKKREDLLIQYNTTNNRWEDGVALTVGDTAPTSPQTNDLWVDTGNSAYIAVTANYEIADNKTTINCTSNSFTVTLPTAIGITNRRYDIKNSGTGVITIATTDSQTIDGFSSGVIKLSQYDSLQLVSTGTNWIIV